MLAALLLSGTFATNRIVPGVSLGNVRIGASVETLKGLGRPYSGDASMQKAWATWLGKGDARLDVYTAVATERPVIRIVRATSSAFRTASGLGPGVSETRIRRAYPQAKDVGTYVPAGGGPPIHIFDDVRQGLAFEVRRGVCLAVAVHGRGRGLATEGLSMRIYLAQPVRKL